MDWPTLVALYPILTKLVAKVPELKDAISDIIDKRRPDGASLLLHLEEMQQMDDLRDYMLMANLACAKLANPKLDDTEFLKAWKFSRDLVETIKSI